MKGSKARWNLTSAQEASRRQVEMNGLELSVSVLSFCAQQDPYAGHFLKTVSIFKDILEAQGLSEPEQPQNPSFGWTNSGLERPSVSYMPRSGSSSEAASSGGLANLDLTPSTVSSTFDLQAYPSTSSHSTPSFSHIQYASAQQFTSPLAQTGSQSDTYPMPLNWSPSSTFVIDPAMDLRINHYAGPTNPITQHYQPFLQDFGHFEDTASRNQS